MGEGWAFTGGPPSPSGTGDVTLVEGRSFCVSARAGDMESSATHGLIVNDTRFVHHLVLRVDGDRLESLGVQAIGPHAATFVTRRKPHAGLADSTLLVVRNRYVGNGIVEDVTVENLSREAVELTLSLAVGADFADLFEVKEGRATRSHEVATSAADGAVTLRSQRDGARAARVTGTGAVSADGSELIWHLAVPARDRASVTVRVEPSVAGTPLLSPYPVGTPHVDSRPSLEHAEWRRRSPRLRSGEPRFDELLETSTHDLTGLRITDATHPERVILAAGAPWFMTIFGRDALLTSWMLLPLDARIALGTLHVLAERQGTTVVPRTEEEPGRILHEVRSGLLTTDESGEDTVYYGTVDATPLFVMLVGELYRWGIPLSQLEPLLPHADRALQWIDEYGDADGDGFVEYERATESGLVNQGWKDSFDGVTFPSGAIPHAPIALAEVQGYVYGALRARSDLAEAFGDHELARRLAVRAAELKQRFNARFWLPHRGYYALALDAEKQPVESLASNMGHCLWTGIIEEQHAPAVAEALLSPEMFTGFGVRTLASSMGAYNPMSYHNGSVWPHDNALVAAGLRRYGFVEEAGRIVLGLLSASEGFGGRLPELFCGFDRAEFARPVPYPTACAPQAWAAASPLFLLRVLLGLEPDLPAGVVEVDPAPPASLLPLSVDQLHVGGATLGLDVTAASWRARGMLDGVRTVAAGAASGGVARIPPETPDPL